MRGQKLLQKKAEIFQRSFAMRFVKGLPVSSVMVGFASSSQFYIVILICCGSKEGN